MILCSVNRIYHITFSTAPIQPTIRRDRMPIPRQSTPYKISSKVTPSKPKVKPPADMSKYSPQVQVTLYTYGLVIILNY